MRLAMLRLIGLVMLWAIHAGTALAAAEAPVVNPGVRIGEWIYTNVTALFTPILAVIAIYYLVKRQFTQFMSFAVFAVVVSLFVYSGAEFKDAAVGLSRWIIGR